MNDELRDTIERAYLIFARYRLEGQIEVCRCNVCVDAETERQLISTSLRDIPSSLLTQYTHSAHGWSPLIADQFRYFLPRYFDLIGAGEDPCYYGEALEQLANVFYRKEWPQAEADAIDAFFVALLRDRLDAPLPAGTPGGQPTYDNGADCVFWLLVAARGDVDILLRAWDDTSGRNADLRLADFVAAQDWWGQRRVQSARWNGQAAAVLAWLQRPVIRERLENACLREEDADACALLSWAEGLLRKPVA